MRTQRVVLLAVALLLIAGACSEGEKPSTPNASASESDEPIMLVTAPPGCEPDGDQLELSAKDDGFDFDKKCLAAPADTAFTITYRNRKCTACGGVARSNKHNVSIYTGDLAHEQVFNGKILSGNETIEYEVPPLAEGVYAFQCILHPPMNGVLVVK